MGTFKSKPSKISPLNKREDDECIVSGMMYYVLRASQLSCVAPVRFQKVKDGWRVAMSRPNTVLVYLFILLLDITTLAYLTADLCCNDYVARFHFSYPIFYFLRFSAYFIVAFAASLGSYRAPIRFRSMIKCLSQMKKIQSELKAKVPNDNKWSVRLSALIVVCTIISFWIFDFLSDRYARKNGWMAVTYKLEQWIGLLMLSQFVYTALEMCSTLKLLNNKLEEILLAQEQKQTDCEQIRRFSSSYAKICMGIEELDQASGPEALMLLIVCFFFIIFLPYIVINMLQSPAPISLVVKSFLVLLGPILSLLTLIQPCHMTQLEIERTRLIVSKFSKSGGSTHLSEALDKLSLFLLGYQVSYSPSAICTLNRNLIATITVNVTTYLVILIQFKMLDSSLKSRT